ncbi:MAG: phosphatidylglycerol lysyltransferase domain-containing protein [Synergistaceae bacterium]|nr:phosphatidylglycerol lysyltransferase domain-containing protein [Synergistaceae bacterium]
MDFVPLALSDRERYSALYSRCSEACSQYSFFALWGWNQTDPIELAWPEDSPLCWIRSGGQKDGLLAPVGDWASVGWTEEFRRVGALLSGAGLPRRLLDVPESLVRALPGDLLAKLTLTELRDEWEYIYSVPELVGLKGGKYAAKRAHIKTFFENCEWEYRPLLPEDFPELLAFQSEWCARRDCAENPLLCAEDLAVRRALEFWDVLPLTGATLSVNGKVAAYTIGEELSPDTIDIRFEKAGSEYAGIYQALNKLFLERQGQAYQWVNREEDMGSEGLRKAKLSYHPGRFLKKYRLDWDGTEVEAEAESG